MPRLLENIDPGTSVRSADGEVLGDVRGVYSTGDSRVAEYLCVFWNRRGDEALLPTEEVLTIDEEGVVLRSSARVYTDLVAYNPQSNPLLHRLH